jgi:hypothetical protein
MEARFDACLSLRLVQRSLFTFNHHFHQLGTGITQTLRQKLRDFDEEFGVNCGMLPCWVERCLLIGRKILFVLLRSHGKNDDECCDSKSCPS